MLLSLADIEQQAKQLPADERARLAEALFESLKDDSLHAIQTAWRREIEKRVAACDRGDVEIFSACVGLRGSKAPESVKHHLEQYCPGGSRFGDGIRKINGLYRAFKRRL